VKTIIVGGGIQGLACAHALARRGIGPITLLEARRVGYGESSRSGGGIRAQFRNEPTIRLAQWSMEIFERLSAELNHHILFHRGGYMYLHYSEKDAAQAERDVALQNSLGVPTQLLNPQKAVRILPGLNARTVRVVQYNARDANCHHDALMWGYLRWLQRHKVTIRTGVRVTALDVEGQRVCGVIAGEERLRADQVIVACGTWSRELLQTVGVHVATQPWRREKLVAEPVHHFLSANVIDKRSGVSFHQAIRGEVLGTAYGPVTGSEMNWASTHQMLENWCRGIYELFPPLRNVAVFRQWAGTRDFTPDGTPIFGPMPGVNGLWAICGQSGVGLMLAPAIAEAIARSCAGLEPGVDWEVYSPLRFEQGRQLWERTPQG
jgi:sarcosine oxidase subunit beta